MKTSKLFLSLSVALLLGVVSCNEKKPAKKYANPEELERIHQLFTSMQEEYNFTLSSSNDFNVRRTLSVYDQYCFYYSFINYSSSGSRGMFYVENQGTQDFHIENDQVVVDFHEGPGKVELVENFAHSDDDSEFAHLPMSQFLNIDWTHFYKIDDDTYYTKDRAINRVFCYYTNEHLSNWNDIYGGNNEERYISFSKSKSTLTFESDGTVTIFFEPYQVMDVGFECEGATLTISNIGETTNETISNYRENPDPISKKEGYGFNSNRYRATLGNVEIPFSDKYSGYISIIEDYNNAVITVYDMSYEDGIVTDIVSQLGSNWTYDEEDSAYWTEQKHHEVKTYKSNSTITEYIQGQYVDNVVEVYISFGVSPVSLEPTQVDKTLRPQGFFVMEIYRKLGQEAVTDVNEIITYLDTYVGEEYLFDLTRLRSYQYLVMRDYTENPTIIHAFEEQGIYLFNYIELRVENLSENHAKSFARSVQNDLSQKECYSEVILDNDFNLTAQPSLDYFSDIEEPLMQILGSPIIDSLGQITGYKLAIICYTVTE